MSKETKGGGLLTGITSIRGGVNTGYQIPQEQRPPDPPPMRPATTAKPSPPAPKKD